VGGTEEDNKWVSVAEKVDGRLEEVREANCGQREGGIGSGCEYSGLIRRRKNIQGESSQKIKKNKLEVEETVGSSAENQIR